MLSALMLPKDPATLSREHKVELGKVQREGKATEDWGHLELVFS